MVCRRVLRRWKLGNAVYEKVGEVIEYEDNVTCYLDLKAGRVDAMVVDEIVGRYLIETE